MVVKGSCDILDLGNMHVHKHLAQYGDVGLIGGSSILYFLLDFIILRAMVLGAWYIALNNKVR